MITLISCLSSHCGIGRYTESLAKHLSMSGQDLVLYRKNAGEASYIQPYPHRSLKGLKHYVAPYYLGKAIANSQSPLWHADYVDGATAFAWARPKGRLIVTAHDAIPLIFGGSWPATAYYKYHLKNASLHAERIIAVSQRSKEDLVERAGIAPERIEVIYNGIDHQFYYPNSDMPQNEVFTIRYIGGLTASHKNACALIETARILEASGLAFRLEIGSGEAQKTPLPALVQQYKLKNVHFVGFVPDSQVREFLAGADAFLYPSLYEGFGFPPLEAMACGTPVVSSSAGSLAEVLGKGAIVTAPSPDDFANALLQLAASPALRLQMRQAGIERASSFNWEKTAAETLRLYEAA